MRRKDVQLWTNLDKTEISIDQTCAPVTHPVSMTLHLSALTKNAMGDYYEILTVSVHSHDFNILELTSNFIIIIMTVHG